MFQGQPSRHNAMLFKRHRRARYFPELLPPNDSTLCHLGMELGGAV